MATPSSTLSRLITSLLSGNKDKNNLCFHQIIILLYILACCSHPAPPQLHQNRALTNSAGQVNEMKFPALLLQSL